MATHVHQATPAHEFRLLLLGPCSLYRDGVPRDVTTWPRSSLVLLALLATASQRQCSRDRLMEVLWPEATPQAAASNLRTALQLLRRGLGGDTPSPILFERGWVRLNQAYTWDIDINRFEQLVRTAGDDTAMLEEAVTLYRGEALQEERYDDWAVPIRESARRRWRDSCLRVARLLTERGEAERAVRYLDAVLEDNPLDEDAVRAILWVLGSVGRRAEALRRYAAFEQRLRRELDLEPEPETRALVDGLRRHTGPASPAVERLAAPVAPPSEFENAAHDRARHWAIPRPRLLAIGGTVVAALLTAGAVLMIRQSSTPRHTASYARLIATWRLSASTSPSLVTPAAVAVGSQEHLYVADSADDRIVVLSARGRVLTSWGVAGARAGGLQNPRGLALDRHGNVYVADTGNDRIEKFSPQGRFLGAFGNRGSRPGQFRSPQAVAVGETGTIYVADTNNGRVQALTPKGTPLRGWDPTGSQHGTLFRPGSLAVRADGQVLVADGPAGQVEILGADGSFLSTLTTVAPPSLVAPSAVAVDNQGHTYVLDSGLDSIRELDANGQVVHAWRRRFGPASSLDIDSHGFVYVADSSHRRILKLAQNGAVLGSWRLSVALARTAFSPAALARDARGNLYVADAGGNQLVVVSPTGRVLRRLSGGTAGPLRQPAGVAVDGHNRVYVVDTGNDRIVKMDASGTVEATWGALGSDPGQLLQPHGVGVDAMGNVYIADSGNSRVERFTSRGVLVWVRYVQEVPLVRGSFISPPSFTGVTIDTSGDIYVTDPANGLVVKLTADGAVVGEWTFRGARFEAPMYPEGVAVSGSGTVYVADASSPRVLVFAPNGKVIGSIRKGLDAPTDVVFAPQGGTGGLLYVTDGARGDIELFSVVA